MYGMILGEKRKDFYKKMLAAAVIVSLASAGSVYSAVNEVSAVKENRAKVLVKNLLPKVEVKKTDKTKTEKKVVKAKSEKTAENKLSKNEVKSEGTFFSKIFKRKLNADVAKPVTVDSNETQTLQANVVMTIDDCVKYAIEHDPNIKNYQSTQKIQKSEVGQAKSNYFPSIYAGTGYNINNSKYFGDRTDSVNNNYYGINAGVNQLIWDFGKTTANINMTKFNYEAAGYDVENAILDSVYNVKISYTAVLAYRANVDIYARSVRINELNVERTKAMYEVGLKSKIDVVNAEATLTDSRINLLEAQNLYQTALIDLNNRMYYVNAPNYLIKDTETFNFQKNYSVKNEINVAYDRKNYDSATVESEIKDGAILTSGIEKRDILKTYRFKPFEYTLNDAIAKAYENRPDLKSMELVKRASEESLKAVKRSYYPELNASAGYTMARRSDYGSNTIGIYAGIDLPTINAMNIKYKIDEGKGYLEIATTNVDLLKKNIYFQVQSYFVNMKQLEKRIPLMSKKVEQTLENFELADGRYSVGLGNYIELQQAQTNYNNAQLAFVQAVFDYNQARYYLEKAIGLR